MSGGNIYVAKYLRCDIMRKAAISLEVGNRARRVVTSISTHEASQL